MMWNHCKTDMNSLLLSEAAEPFYFPTDALKRLLEGGQPELLLNIEVFRHCRYEDLHCYTEQKMVVIILVTLKCCPHFVC